MQRDYYDPLSRDRGLAENQDPTAGAPPRRTGEPYDPEQEGEGMGERARETTEEVRERAEEMGQQVRERAGQMGEQARERAEQGKEATASGLDTAADQIRERVGRGEGTAAQAGTKVADNLERTAGYLREHEAGEMWQDVERYVKDHPMRAAVGALAAGFVVGRMLR